MTTFFLSIGGLGLFLLGMVIMTDALQSLAGKAVRTALMRFTKSPLSGAVTGAASTAILQSSSATTVAAVGFVGAGLLSFSESLGIIFGANIGTTLKGWLVALLGFKFQLEIFLLPFIFIGVAMRLFSNGKLAHLGMSIAGFSLIFVGIGSMQQGMTGLEGIVTPDIFPEDTLIGRLKLVAMGIIITVITQSSSAGVAAALTAVYTGTITFEQAAALVIGMDVGTTVTAAMATIGGSVSSRRTGFSHVIYNLMTGVGALILLTPFTLVWEAINPGGLIERAEIALVAFHTSFNTIGVIVVLPFTATFARFIQNIIPDKADAYTQSLEKQLITEPYLALTAAQASVHSELKALLKHLTSMLDDKYKDEKINLTSLQTSLDETHAYVDLIHLDKSDDPDWKALIAIIHSLDHMQRLHERCDEDIDRAIAAKQTPELQSYIEIIKSKTLEIIGDIENNNWNEAADTAKEFASMMSKEDKDIRQMIMTNIANGTIDVPTGTDSLEAIRWLRRVSAHILRITHHQTKAQKHLRKL